MSDSQLLYFQQNTCHTDPILTLLILETVTWLYDNKMQINFAWPCLFTQ